jgi:disulfide bond formation protein DsbB
MNPLSWSFRTGFAVAAAIIAVFIGYALYAQHVLALEPCPLCILQRVAFIALFVVCAIAALHAPRGGLGRKVYGALALLAAGSGAAIAGRHVWLQHLPADQVPSCGPGLDYMLEAFPLSKALSMVFTGSGECAKVDGTFAGLSMPEWTLVWFAVFMLGALYYGFRNYAPR